jgi:hypothetical protein
MVSGREIDHFSKIGGGLLGAWLIREEGEEQLQPSSFVRL